MYGRCFLLLGVLLISTDCASAFTSPARSIKKANLLREKNKQHDTFGFASRTPSASTSSLTMISGSSPVAWAVGHAVGGALGAPIVAKAVKTWYKKIDLPPWTPPDRLFAPTWTVLYSAMGVAACRVYQRTGCSLTSTPMKLWLVHYFFFNLPWAPAFFGMKRLRLGLVLNFLMLGSLAGLIIPLFYANNALSGLLLLPYLAWLSLATVLNYAVCKRNPTDKDGYNAAKFEAGLALLQKDAATYAGV